MQNHDQKETNSELDSVGFKYTESKGIVEYPNVTENPPDEIARTSFLLGIILGISIGLIPTLHFKGISLYVISLMTFHFLEYYITARYNPKNANSDSFLLFSNGIAYLAAQLFAIAECFLEFIFFPHMKFPSTKIRVGILLLGLTLTVSGQVVRSLAMITAGRSFSHIIKRKKEKGHMLVTNGIYGYLRHPSYFGYFWWALGTQWLLLNPVSLVLFAIVLWLFFKKRIAVEEEHLVRFFGAEYENYRRRVGVWIPFIY